MDLWTVTSATLLMVFLWVLDYVLILDGLNIPLFAMMDDCSFLFSFAI